MSSNPRVLEFQIYETKRQLRRNIKDLKTFTTLKTICMVIIAITVIVILFFFNPSKKRDL